LFVGELDLTRRIRPPEETYLAALASLLTGPQRGRFRRLYISDECAARFGAMRPAEAGQTVGGVVEVRGVRTLESVIVDLWPDLSSR
jgi:hypothetical protein